MQILSGLQKAWKRNLTELIVGGGREKQLRWLAVGPVIATASCNRKKLLLREG